MPVLEKHRPGITVEPVRFDQPVAVPETPPTEWLSKPDWLEPGQKLTVLASGQAAGYWFQKGTCLVHDPRACPKPDPTGYRMFKQNGTLPTLTASGQLEAVEVGVIGNVHGHADPRATVAQAQAHYSDPSAAMLIGTCGDDEYGAWFAGCLLPDREWTGRDVAFLNRCALSGDWRPLPYDSPWWEQNGVDRAAVMAAEGYSSLGPTLVTRPALPLVQSFPMAASAWTSTTSDVPDDRPVLLGGLGGVQLPDDGEAYSASQPCSCHERTASVPDTDELSRPAAEALANLETALEPILGAGPPVAQQTTARARGRAAPPVRGAARQDTQPGSSSLEQRVAALEAAVRTILDKEQGEQQAAVHERMAAVELPDLPAPDGFDDRTWIEYTIADLEWLESSGRIAAPAPSPKSAPDRPSSQRKKDAASGVARPDGSFPIRNAGDLANAKRAIGRANPGDRAAVIAHINRRAKALGLPGVGQSSDSKKAA